MVFHYRAELQVATTQDYATDSWFWTVFTGKIIGICITNMHDTYIV